MTSWLLAWLWQGAAIAAALAGLWCVAPRVNAATRYSIWWLGLAALPLIGWLSSPMNIMPTPMPIAAAAGALPRVAIAVQPWPASVLTALAAIWLAGALAGLLRVLPGMNALYRLKRACRPLPAGVEAQLPMWRDQSNAGRRAKLMLCDGLASPAVLGLHDPYIALPSALVAHLSVDDLDQIVLHELAHVRRRDDWTRLAQALLHAALWMHPAAFVIGRELNLEREVSCDDWVVARTGDPRRYARCLARVAEHHRRGADPFFAPALFEAHRSLLRRVNRLLDPAHNTARGISSRALFVATASMVLCVAALPALPLIEEEMGPGVNFDPPVSSELTSGGNSPVAVVTGSIETRSRSARLAPETPLLATPAEIDSRPQFPTAEIDPRPQLIGRSLPVKAGVAVAETREAAGRTESITPWQAAATAGTTLGERAARAGTGLGATFGRMGKGLGASFARR